MIPYEASAEGRRKARRHLLQQYVRVQRELVEGEPGSAAYRASVHALRQLGYVLISWGFEDDLDRLLRIRVLNGGCPAPRPRTSREVANLQLVELRQPHDLQPT